jgi:hypothetical protein
MRWVGAAECGPGLRYNFDRLLRVAQNHSATGVRSARNKTPITARTRRTGGNLFAKRLEVDGASMTHPTPAMRHVISGEVLATGGGHPRFVLRWVSAFLRSKRAILRGLTTWSFVDILY